MSSPTKQAVAEVQVTARELEAGGVKYPRVVIEYCTQCKWMLRAAYYAQELLSTFSSGPIPPPPPPSSSQPPASASPSSPPQTPYIADISLQPAPSGTFTVSIYTTTTTTSTTTSQDDTITITKHALWSRATDGGFPETKELKRRVRDVLDPGRGLGHVDRVGGKKDEGGRKEVEEVVVVAGGGGGGKCAARRKAREAEAEAGAGGEAKTECLDCQ